MFVGPVTHGACDLSTQQRILAERRDAAVRAALGRRRRSLRERVGDLRGIEPRAPLLLDRADREAVRFRELLPPLGEEPREGHEHLVPGREAVLDRGLEPAGAGGRHQQDVGVLGPVELLQAPRDLAHQVPEARSPVVDEWAPLREEHLWRDGGRSGGQDDLRPVHARLLGSIGFASASPA